MQRSCLTAAGAALLIVLGLVPRANAQQPRRLTLKEAIELGLRSNISVLSSRTKFREAAGTTERRWSDLLPKSYIQTSYALERVNLRALGIDIPFIGVAVGPFAAYDFRVYVNQPILDLQAYHNWKSSHSNEEAMGNDYQNSRDLVIQTVASLYLSAETSAALVDTAQSRVTLSEALLKLANYQHEAGVATGLDVLRAKVQLADDQQALLVAKNTAQQALLVLSRNIGLEVGTPLELAETLNYQPINAPALREAISEALANRPDYLSLVRQRDEQVELQKASQARSLPEISLSGNYGAAGRSIGGITSVGALQGVLKWNIFDRDRGGEAQEVASRVERVESQIADLTLQIEEDVHEALLNLDSANNEVRVAQDALTLAQQELDLARVTFQAGATNNIEVTTAQDSLSRAQQNLVTALTRHVNAKIALARALGGTEKNYDRFLGD